LNRQFFLAQANSLTLQLQDAFFLGPLIDLVCMELSKPAAARLPTARQHQGMNQKGSDKSAVFMPEDLSVSRPSIAQVDFYTLHRHNKGSSREG
jgi:hypothetical protein